MRRKEKEVNEKMAKKRENGIKRGEEKEKDRGENKKVFFFSSLAYQSFRRFKEEIKT